MIHDLCGSKGLEIEEVAELLSFSTRWVYELVRRYNEGGPDCLGDQRVNNGAEARILTAEALAAQGFEVDKRRIQLAEPIKTVGQYEVGVKLVHGVTATFKVDVTREA